ncbi:MAG: hypothetical protein JW822_13275 [Spirochaetales bacterium]|nr:hypothetical protein [Spirochaetales bacterium]
MKLILPGMLLIILLICSCSPDVKPQQIPVYIEDYHTGSFFWLAEHLDWNEEYVLFLFDMHSDAFAVYRSRDLRKDLVAARNRNKLSDFLKKLKEHNIIQCYNWLEPLMPFPVSRVIWISPHHIDRELEEVLRAQVKKELCAGGDAAGTASCALKKLFTITDLEGLLTQELSDKPCVVSIDLDYFANVNDEASETRLHSVLDFTFMLPHLKAVTVAISNIYLKNNPQGHRLLFILIKYLVGSKNLIVFFEPFITYKEDTSREAREFMEQGKKLPAYDIEQAPDYLKQLVCAYKTRIIVRHDNERWQNLLAEWQQER